MNLQRVITKLSSLQLWFVFRPVALQLWFTLSTLISIVLTERPD